MHLVNFVLSNCHNGMHVSKMDISFFPQLIIAVAGVLTGYNGSFEFKEPGQVYGDTPYVGMRVVSVTCGHGVV